MIVLLIWDPYKLQGQKMVTYLNSLFLTGLEEQHLSFVSCVIHIGDLIDFTISTWTWKMVIMIREAMIKSKEDKND